MISIILYILFVVYISLAVQTSGHFTSFKAELVVRGIILICLLFPLIPVLV